MRLDLRLRRYHCSTTEAVSPNFGRIHSFDIARGLSIVLVVLFHAFIILNRMGGLAPQLWIISDFFSAIRMPIFFAISGMLGSKILRVSWSELLKRRIILLVYLYLVWTFIDFVVNEVLGAQSGLSLWITWFIWPNPVLWFIWALSIYFCIARICLDKMQFGATMACLALAIAMAIKPDLADTSEHLKTLAYAFFFMLGVYYGKLLMAILRHWKIALAISSLAYTVLFLAERRGYVPQDFLVVLPGFGLVAGLTGAKMLEFIPIINGALAYFGRNTLTIYLSHNQILKVFSRLSGDLVALPGYDVWGLWVACAVAIAIPLALRPVLEAVGGAFLYALPGSAISLMRSPANDPKTNQSDNSIIRTISAGKTNHFKQ